MAKKKTGKPSRELHAGTHASWMARPNLLVPLMEEDDLPRRFFPLLSLRDGGPSDSDVECVAIFFDKMHGNGWTDWIDRAPTWMDPHKFVAMALQQKQVQGCLKCCFERNSETPAVRDMPEMLDEVMEEYLEYMLEQFEAAKPYLIDWMVRNHCYKETDPAVQESKQKKKRAPRRAAK